MPLPTYQKDPLQAVLRIKSLLRLEALLALLMRMGVVTALLSITSYQLSPHDNPRQSWGPGASIFYGFGDMMVVCWLVLSTAVFFPCAVFIDLVLCGVLINRITGANIVWFIHWTPIERSISYLTDLDSLVEVIVVCAIGLLRVLGLALAIVEACHSDAEESSSFCWKLFGFVVEYRYDWWTFKPLPEDFVARKWYRRVYRPWLPKPQAPVAIPPAEVVVTPVLHIFLGTRTFLNRRGERSWFVVVRGAAAIACLGALVAYALNVLFLQLNDENRTPTIQVRRIPTLSVSDRISPPTWGVVVGVNSRYVNLPPGVDLDSFVSVAEELQISSDEAVPCPSVRFSSEEAFLKYFYFVSYQCDIVRQVGPLFYTPQIRISLDYAGLNVTTSKFTPEGTVKIWPRFTDSISDVLTSTKPISLVMGSDLIASVEESLWTHPGAPLQATLGIDSSQQMHAIARVSVLGPDPLAGPRSNRSSTFASMRLFKEVQTTDRNLYSNVKQHTVFSGLSALGGLTAFFNSTFVVLFGGSLMLVLFNIKPLSTFGVLHSFSKAALADLFEESFPLLHAEGGQPGHGDSGVISFMRESMVDLPPLPIAANPLL